MHTHLHAGMRATKLSLFNLLVMQPLTRFVSATYACCVLGVLSCVALAARPV